MRTLMTFSLSFAVAAALWQLALLWLTVPAALILIVAAIRMRDLRRLRAGILAGGLLFGALWCQGYDLLLSYPAHALDGTTGEVTVRLTEFPTQSAYSTEVRGKLVRQGADVPVLLRLDGEGTELRPGDTVRVDAALYRADLAYGERTWRDTADGVLLRAYATGDYVVTSGGSAVNYLPQYVSRAIKESVAESFPADTVGFVTAILTGDKTAFTGTTYDNLRDAGAAHIVAVSGMHVSFLVTLLMLLLGRGRRASLIGIPVVVFFVLVAGATPSVVRAGIMQVLLLLGGLLERETDGPTSMGAALLLILLADPASIASVSLQLSFLSVAGLITVTPRVYAYLSGLVTARGRWGKGALRFLWASLAASVGAIVFSTPATVFHFGSVSTYALLTNLLVTWAAAIAFAGGLIVALMGMAFIPLGRVAAWPVALLARYIQWVAAGVSAFPLAVIPTYSGYIRLWLVAVYALAAASLFYRGEKPRPSLPIGLGVGLLVYCLFLGGLEAGTGQMTVTALDVGQGQSVLLSSAGANVLVDCGGDGGGAAGDIAAEYLFAQSVYRLDFLVITHFDADHINGVERLMRRVEVGTLAVPDVPDADSSDRRERILTLAEELGVPVYTVRANTVYAWGDDSLTLYAPLGTATDNERGVSVLMRSGDFDVLVTGDMPSELERRLVQLVDLPDIEVLVAGHHGSKYSSSEELLETVLAEVAIISVGEGNSYGHPAPEAMARLDDYGAAIYRTDRSGHITVRAGR